MRPGELTQVRALAQRAFGDDSSIGELIDALRASWAWVDELSFVAELDGELVGQVLYTRAWLDTPARLVDVLVLSPVGVRPDVQRCGIGSRLITTTLAVIGARPEPMVFLEGHPAYYPRFGFEPAARLGVVAPSRRIPPEAFMTFRLPSYAPTMTGTLVYPDAFWRCDAVGLRPAVADDEAHGGPGGGDRSGARRRDDHRSRVRDTSGVLRLGSIVVGAEDPARAAAFWAAVFGYEIVTFPGSADDFTILLPPDRVGTRIAVHRSETPAPERPRVHLDVVVDTAAEQSSEIDRLVRLGATRVPWTYPTDADFVVMADTEGNRFCIVDASHG
jgi:putative acetyltransferase